ncbi:MAG: hypothetical protein R3234_00765 [Thermoanaerobaculia bacterium]|nr:hypothetical protein [Thermoanaerobaculia bacterium]
MADPAVARRHDSGRGGDPRHRRAAARGSLLLETLIALTLLAIAVLLTVSLLTLEARGRRARSVGRQVLSAQEAVLEALRSGQLALESASFEEEELEILLDRSLPSLDLWVEVEDTEVDGLREVVVSARYVAGARLRLSRVPTRMRAEE